VAADANRGSRSRRVRIPGIAELLRPHLDSTAVDGLAVLDEHRQATGREGHTQKITVYLSADELLDLEQARLRLRGFGVSVDRGRLVREALAVLLADLDARGEDSVLANRLNRAGDNRASDNRASENRAGDNRAHDDQGNSSHDGR
jgi:hypothetical protein